MARQAPRTVFHELEEGGYSALFYALDYIGDVSYLVDIVVHMFTGYLEEGVLVTEPRKLIKAYVRTKASKLDMLSVFPTVRINDTVKMRRLALSRHLVDWGGVRRFPIFNTGNKFLR